MPPKSQYSREEVVRAAVSVVEEDGLNALTARSVAAKLGASTALVYQHFATMDELAMAVIRETKRVLEEYTSRPYTERLFLNMGTGVAMFASEHPLLYKALLLEGDSYRPVIREFFETLESELIRDARLTHLSDEERRVLLTKMWTFTHGLASLICVGLIKDCNQDFIVSTLLDVGGDVIGATLEKHKRAGSSA